MKKPTGSVFEKPKKPNQTEPKQKKTEPNRKNRVKTRKTEPNRSEPVFFLKNQNRTKTCRFEPVRFGFGFFFLKIDLITFFFIKTEPNQK